MRIGFLEEMYAIGDNATRFKALAILRGLYPNDTIIFYGRKNFAKMFFHSNVFDEFVDIDGWHLDTQWRRRGGGFKL